MQARRVGKSWWPVGYCHHQLHFHDGHMESMREWIDAAEAEPTSIVELDAEF